MSLYGLQVRTDYLSVIIVLHGEEKVFLLILWVLLLLLGIVKQAPWILFFILLILAYSRDGIIHSIFETGCMSLTSISILFNYCWTCRILSFCTCVIWAWKIKSSWTAVSFFWQYHREYRQHWREYRQCALHRISFSLSYPQQYDVCIVMGVTHSSKEKT